MSILNKIVNKATAKLEVLDSLGIKHSIKVLNFVSSGSRTSKLDRQCVTNSNTSIVVGTELILNNDTTLVVSYKQADWYKESIVRFVLDCIDTNQTIDIYRNQLEKSSQGGLSKQVDTLVYQNVPVKIGLYEANDVKAINISLPKYVMYLSIRYSLQSGDRLVVSDTSFEVAKVNSFVHVTPGLMEVRFDKDPRWL